MVVDSAMLVHGESTQDHVGTKQGTVIAIWLEHTTKEIVSYDTVPLNCKEHKWQWMRWELSTE
ncbi:hypothetical protein PAXRUDRAFT_157606 [Paxillus rubicundulus Ve08.2h10]|uniref:Uncharacterized protein n=1 Tax=Paxillus rubicundulus Ve08.2h10 TaxID=930991 RepID=A0A0D0DHC8_9AGAM|nr:hypothetical protein PAXRUDRAFT_157606 [Paxillus rubicundulus Ve08.2h10]